MNHACNCKFCGKNMVVEIDNDYAELGDPFKLLQYAACNHCADLRERKRTLDQGIRKICISLTRCSMKDLKAATSFAKTQLDALTRKYAVLVSDWYNKSGYLWDEEFPTMMLEKPERVNDILTQYWKTFKQVNNIKF